MEWNRAKNILIIIFLVIDIVLGVIILNQDNKSITVSSKEIEDCRKILKDNNIILQTDIPCKISGLSTIPFRNVVYSDSYMDRYVNDNHRHASISNDGVFQLQESYYEAGRYDVEKSEKEISQDINNILRDKRIDTSYRKKKVIFSRTPYSVSLEYGERYKGYDIANSKLVVTIDKATGFIDIEYRWYIPEKASNTEQELVSPLDSVIVVMNKIREESKKAVYMRDVRICYLAEKSSKGAKTIDGVPAWEITTYSGKTIRKYYVDAYENKLKEI